MPKKKRPALIAKQSMEALGLYKKEFDPIIEVYGELMEQYETIGAEFAASGFNYLETTKDGTKKAPIVTTLETLRKDILSYAAQLGLTPQGLLKANDSVFRQKKVSALAEALKAAAE